MRQALADDTHLLLEATSNQVNQAGGYTGMTPAAFRDFVHGIAARLGFDVARLILGGDHLGPNPWQSLDSATAMRHAIVMVKQYVEAGFTKIHLDASMRCADDPKFLPDSVMAQRAAEMCRAAEESRAAHNLPAVVYVIGTEVPVPGGATHAIDGLEVTRTAAAEQTFAVHQQAFEALGLQEAWQRVVAMVIQPGVEFNHDSVIDYVPEKAAHLQSFLNAHPGLVMEAHSSDYQLPQAYEALIHDGFAILKVGPALTFAMRETLYALASIEGEVLPADRTSHLRQTMEQTMLAHPKDWQKYYHGSEQEQRLLRVYSYSDRIRYYWHFPQAEAAVQTLLSNLAATSIPETLLSQYCPRQYDLVRAGKLANEPKELVIRSIMAVLETYNQACLGRQ